VEEHVALLCSRINALGYEPLVICAELEALGPLYRRLDALGVRRRIFDAGETPVARLTSVPRLARIFRAEKVDVLHVQLVSAEGGRIPILAGRLANIPTVVTHHAAPRSPQSLATRLSRWPLMALVDRFVAVSHANRDDHIRHMGLAGGRLTAIHNGIVVPEAAPDRATARQALLRDLGLSPESKLVGAAGRLCEQKGFHLLLNAAEKLKTSLPNAHFLLIGDGPLRGELEAQAARLGLSSQVHFLGFRNDTPALLAALDLLAMPSIFEGLPLVLLEAFAAGCPVVAHEVDGIPEVVEDCVDGFLVPSGDVSMLAARIEQLLGDTALAARMSQAARRKAVEKLTVERMARETSGVYAELLAR